MSEPWVAPGSSTPPESADHGQAGPPHVGSEPPRPYAAPPGFGSAPPPPYPAATHSVPPQGVAPHGVAPAGVPGAWRPAFDFRPGGAFHTYMTAPEGPSGGESDNPGLFLEIRPMERIVCTSMLVEGWRPAAPWIAITGFFTVAITLTLMVFIGEAVRDAFDPRKAFR